MRSHPLLNAAVFLLGALALIVTATPAQASSFTYNPATFTYTYIGDLFNVCGYGCPQNSPGNPIGVDYITATLTYGAKLAGNLTDASPAPTSWTMMDFLNGFSFSGIGLPNGIPADGGDPPVPGLVLSTDANGDLIRWIMSASIGSINGGFFMGTEAVILNPPIFCGEECGNGGITDFVALRLRSNPDTEWDAGRIVAAPVPEPATLTLLGGGLLAAASRKLRRRR